MSLDRRILIADDDREVRIGVAELLGDLGLGIVEAERGDLALEIVRGGGVDLALLDNQMPGSTGLEVLRALRSETIAVPCIFCSGDLTAGLERMALAAGAFAILRKPVQPGLLRNEVLRALALVDPLDPGLPPRHSA